MRKLQIHILYNIDKTSLSNILKYNTKNRKIINKTNYKQISYPNTNQKNHFYTNGI